MPWGLHPENIDSTHMYLALSAISGLSYFGWLRLPASTKHLHNICTMLPDVIQMFCVCWELLSIIRIKWYALFYQNLIKMTIMCCSTQWRNIWSIIFDDSSFFWEIWKKYRQKSLKKCGQKKSLLTELIKQQMARYIWGRHTTQSYISVLQRNIESLSDVHHKICGVKYKMFASIKKVQPPQPPPYI